MERLAIITPDCFIDTDIVIIKELAKNYNLLWILTYLLDPKNQELKYPIDKMVIFCKENGIKNKIVISKLRIRNPFNIINAIQVLKEIVKFKPAIVYFNNFGNIYLPILAKITIRSKIIVSIHDVNPHTGSESFFHQLNYLLINNVFQNFHFFSGTQSLIFKNKYRNKNIFTIPLAIKNYGISSVGTSLMPQNRKTCFLFFGTIHFYKGLDILISAANILGRQRKDFKILICGANYTQINFENLVEDPELFEFRTNLIPNNKIPETFSEANFLILPYRDVTQSGPLFIAYNYGIPVVASNHPGFKECIVESETGFIFRTEDSTDLANIMNQCLQLSTIEWKDMSKSIHQFVKDNYSIEIVANKYKEMFDLLIGK